MSLHEELKKINIPHDVPSGKQAEELESQILEMAQLKSEFDVEKYTLATKGPFLASRFHFLMKQYHHAYREAKQMLIERDEMIRTIDDLRKQIEDGNVNKVIYTNEGMKMIWLDLEIDKLKNNIGNLEVALVNKLAMCNMFEKCRLKLIELNGGKAPTNEQFQAEQPEQQKWMLMQQARLQIDSRITGASEGTLLALDWLQEPAMLNPAFQVELPRLESGQVDLRAKLDVGNMNDKLLRS